MHRAPATLAQPCGNPAALPPAAARPTLGVMEGSAIWLCGRLRVRMAGRDVDLPGRQGRLVMAYLVTARGRSVARDELLDLLWPVDPPDEPGEVLSALLSRTRRALGRGVIEGRRDLELVLPEGTVVDLEAAHDAAGRAELALHAEEWRAAWESAAEAAGIAARGFLTGEDSPWVEERRRDVEQLRVRSLEAFAAAGIALGGPERSGAERAAREIVAAAPYSESGHRLLMEALAARGDVAEALRAYDRLRVLLRDDLGTAPGPTVQALHRRLLLGEVERREEPAPPERAAPPREERKLVTVLCAEPAPPGDPSDPEELRDALAEVQERLRAVVERFGGVVQGPAPAPALFGAAEAHEDDAERAIRAALAARERGDVRRAAVASGEAIVEGPGAATGQVVARAGELLAAVPGGGVAVDEATARAAHRSVDFERRDGVILVRRLRDPSRRPTVSTPLVGRARELATLAELYGTVIDRGMPRLVTLVGHAGIGKSRLAEEFAGRAEAGGATVYRGRCLHYGERIAFWPLREILCEAAGIALDDPAGAARRKLRALAEPLGLDEPTVAALGASAGIALGDGSLDGISPSEVAEEVALAWPLFLSTRAQPGPLVLVIEDLHWAGPELLVTLERIVARSEGPLMLLATARPEFAESNPTWSQRHAMSQIALDALSTDESRELADRLLPGAPGAVRERVAELAEGHPFFAEEIARHIAAGGDPSASLPHGLRALLAARIDALPSAEKSALQHAAVVGRRFWLSALEPNLTGRPLPELVTSLEERGLVIARPRSALPGEREFWFAHGLTREVAYRSIPHAARSRTHAAVAAWLERLAGDRREEFIYLLAYHYEAAAAKMDEPIRRAAVRTLLEAGSAARRGLLSVDPIGLADRALALASTDRERLAALELRARGYHAAVRGDEALSAYLEAIELALALGDRRAAANLRAHAALLCARYMGAFSDASWVPSARALVREGLAEVDERTDSFELGALLLARSWGNARWRDVAQRHVRGAKDDMERALAIAERLGSTYLMAHALEGMTWLVLEEGYCEAEAMGDRLERAADLLSNRVEGHESVGVAAMCFARAGSFERARAAAAKATRQAARLSAHRALHAGAAATVALVPPGGFAELLDATARVEELAEREGDRICATGLIALAGRALGVFEAGREQEAERMVALLRRVAPSAGRFRTFGYPAAQILRPVLGRDATMAFIEESEWRRNTGETVVRLRAVLSVLTAGGDPDEVRRTVAEARALAGPACAPALGWIADLAEAALWAREGEVDRGLRQARRAAGALDRHGERYTAARYLAELLPQFAGAAGSAELAQRTAERLTGMGALASARLLLASSAPWRTSATP
jgi:DNA-binding SARP family transcriptional activator